MKTSYRFLASPSACGYLPRETWRLEYEYVLALDVAEYAEHILHGWRRFGRTLFRPRCPRCSACQSLRVVVDAFRPNRSQRRARAANADATRLAIGPPSARREHLALYARFHRHQARAKGWPDRIDDAESFRESFVDNPFPTEQWRFERDGRLVGLGYVDALPIGLSAIYFVRDPAHDAWSLGTWNVLSLIAEAEARGLPHVYLGYYVADCPSLAYKANFRPFEVLRPDGRWGPPECGWRMADSG